MLKIFSTIGVQAALEELALVFERNSGQALDISWATAPMLVRRLQAGETADAMILNRAGIETMLAERRIVGGSEVVIASSAVAIAVKRGAPKPDISTPEALKRTLLAVRSISYTDPAAGGASGIYFAQLLERLGIAAEVNAKTIYPPAGGYTGHFLLTDQAALAVQQLPELLHVPGTDIVGPLPGDLNMVTVFVAGIGIDCQRKEAASALIGFLRSPDAIRVFKEKGLGLD